MNCVKACFSGVWSTSDSARRPIRLRIARREHRRWRASWSRVHSQGPKHARSGSGTPQHQQTRQKELTPKRSKKCCTAASTFCRLWFTNLLPLRVSLQRQVLNLEFWGSQGPGRNRNSTKICSQDNAPPMQSTSVSLWQQYSE